MSLDLVQLGSSVIDLDVDLYNVDPSEKKQQKTALTFRM